MGFLSSPPSPPPPDPKIAEAKAKAESDAKKKREDEEARKTEEAAQTTAGFRGSRALLSHDFTGFANGRGFFSGTGGGF